MDRSSSHPTARAHLVLPLIAAFVLAAGLLVADAGHASAETGAFTGSSVPASGGVALAVWGGGSNDLLAPAAQADLNCNLSSAFATVSGSFVGFVVGAPTFVNASFTARFPAGVPANTPLVLGCSAAAGPSPTPSPTASPTTDAYDPTLTRDDVDCSLEALSGGSDEFNFTTAHYVVGDTLGAACYGEANQTVIDAWEILRTITPPNEFDTLNLFAGFDNESDTYAYVSFVGDNAGTGFQMTLNIPLTEDDPNELLLTLVHEFTHVFVQETGQIDYTQTFDTCTTWYDSGCVEADSYLWAWIQDFWGDGLIDQIVDGVDSGSAEDRCAADASFVGSYAATSPHEDFAEAFSAYVLGTTVPAASQARIDFFAQYPTLVEFHTRAQAAGYTGIQSTNFGGCGS